MVVVNPNSTDLKAIVARLRARCTAIGADAEILAIEVGAAEFIHSITGYFIALQRRGEEACISVADASAVKSAAHRAKSARQEPATPEGQAPRQRAALTQQPRVAPSDREAQVVLRTHGSCTCSWGMAVSKSIMLFERHVTAPSLYNYLGDGRAARWEHEQQVTSWQNVWRL